MKLVVKLSLYDDSSSNVYAEPNVIEVLGISAPPQAFRAMVSAVAREFTETIDAMVDTMNSKTNKEIE